MKTIKKFCFMQFVAFLGYFSINSAFCQNKLHTNASFSVCTSKLDTTGIKHLSISELSDMVIKRGPRSEQAWTELKFRGFKYEITKKIFNEVPEMRKNIIAFLENRYFHYESGDLELNFPNQIFHLAKDNEFIRDEMVEFVLRGGKHTTDLATKFFHNFKDHREKIFLGLIKYGTNTFFYSLLANPDYSDRAIAVLKNRNISDNMYVDIFSICQNTEEKCLRLD